MKRAALVAVAVVLGAAVIALAILALRRERISACPTCGVQRTLVTSRLLGFTLRDTVSASALCGVALEKYGVAHEHRWLTREEMEQALELMRAGKRTVVVRPWDDAGVLMAARRLEAATPRLGKTFIQTWLNPGEESDFKTAFLAELVIKLNALMRDPETERGTVQAYMPLIMYSSIGRADEIKLRSWLRGK